jgi:superfamily II DNA/RNA helicase
MQNTLKNLQEILAKLNIRELNVMQRKAHEAISHKKDIVLLSPTGTGKTLAFLLPILAELDPDKTEVQALILVPSRELAIQIEQVTREMGAGFKVNAVYGGRAFSKDKLELKHPPSILIGTPGRIADHFRRESFSVESINILVLDEYDKSLETGFEAEMKEIVNSLPNLEKRILTSATQQDEIPRFVGVKKPETLNFLKSNSPAITIKTIATSGKDKLSTLLTLLRETGNKSGLIFCNLKDSIADVSEFLRKNNMPHGIFSGGMEQKDRERSLIKFRNGTHRLLIATDLAARGIDVPEIDFIIHYQLPLKAEEFTHRNGRTARMHQKGTAFVLYDERKKLPDFIQKNEHQLSRHKNKQQPVINQGKSRDIKSTGGNKTLFVSGGRKDKISKGDIAGLFIKEGNLGKEELGLIELKQDCAFVAVPNEKAEALIKKLNNTRLKRKKVRITIL